MLFCSLLLRPKIVVDPRLAWLFASWTGMLLDQHTAPPIRVQACVFVCVVLREPVLAVA